MTYSPEDDGDDGSGGDDGEDNSVPGAAAWQWFLQLQGWQSERVLGRQTASVVWREYQVFLYRLARGLLGGGGF